MSVTLTFALAGLATFALRGFIIIFGDRLPASPKAEVAVGLVAPALLAGIVASAIFLDGGQLAMPNLLTALAIFGAAVAVYRTDNVGMALFVGLPIFWIGSLLGLA